MTQLTCPKCGQSEPLAVFNGWPQARHDGSWCIACTWQWRAERDAAARERHRQRRAAERQVVFDHYGWQCACCGSGYRLVIDHVHGDGREQRAEIGENGLYRWLIAHEFPGEDFQTLCGPCNSSKRRGARCKLNHAVAA